MNQLELIPALAEHEPILANLLELYAHDFSEFHPLAIGKSGRFGYPHLPLYWSEADRYPFLIELDGRWAGFVFVKRGSVVSGDTAVWDMAEFFVLRGYRKLGVGTEAALTVWRMFPGAWEVRVMEGNSSALRFWASSISEFVGGTVDPVLALVDGKSWSVFSFESMDIEARDGLGN